MYRHIIGAVLGLSVGFWSVGAQAEVLVLKSDGEAWVEDQQGQKRNAENNLKLKDKETVRTGEDGRAVVDMNGNVVVMGEKSKMVIEEGGWLHHLAGKVYYTFRKLLGGGNEERKVRTPVATIGIRGTRFMIAGEGENIDLAMEEGKVEVEPEAGQFKLYKEKEEQAFDDFRREMEMGVQAMKDEFEQYKQAQEREFIAYVESLTVTDGQMIRMQGDEATESQVSDETQAVMEGLRDYASDILDQETYEGL